jgi:hypothetical protein
MMKGAMMMTVMTTIEMKNYNGFLRKWGSFSHHCRGGLPIEKGDNKRRVALDNNTFT